jgi:NitT/TauT family transport system permease protein
MRKWWLPWTGVVVFLGVWYIASACRLVPKFILDPPHSVVVAVVRLLGTRDVWANIGATLYRTIAGFGLAALVGIPIGLLTGYASIARQSTEPMIDFLRSIPATALLPLFMIVLGIGDSGKIALVAFSATLIIVVYTMLGVQSSSKAKQNYARTLGASKTFILLRVVLPDALPSAFNGLRVSISLALVLVIVAEMLMLGGRPGLGGLVYNARFSLNYTDMFGLIMICGLVGFGLNRVFKAFGARFIHWEGK